MTTILEIIEKHGLDFKMDIDIYVRRNNEYILNMSKDELNLLKYSTILCSTGHRNCALKILNEWEGSKTSKLFWNILNDHFHGQEIINKLREEILKTDDPSYIVNDMIDSWKNSNIRSSQRIEQLFYEESITEDSFLFKVLNEEMYLKMIEYDIVSDIFITCDIIPQKFFDLMYKHLDTLKEKTGDIYGTLFKGFYELIDFSLLGNDNKHTKDLIYGIISSVDKERRLGYLKKIEEYVPNLLELVMDSNSYTLYNSYIVYKTLNIERNDVTYENVVNLSMNDIILLRSTYPVKLNQIITSDEFRNNMKLSLVQYSEFIPYLSISEESLCKYLDKNIGILTKSISLHKLIKLKLWDNDGENLKKYVKHYQVEEIAKVINLLSCDRTYGVSYGIVLTILDALLEMDRENYKLIKLNNFF